jgi:hypothetical protein
MVDEKEEKNGRQQVDKYIDQMIAKNVEPTKIVIQSKSQTSYRSVRHSGIVAVSIKGSFKILPGYFFQMQIGIISNVWFIIKMP